MQLSGRGMKKTRRYGKYESFFARLEKHDTITLHTLKSYARRVGYCHLAMSRMHGRRKTTATIHLDLLIWHDRLAK